MVSLELTPEPFNPVVFKPVIQRKIFGTVSHQTGDGKG